MGKALEIISGFDAAPAGTFQSLTPNTGDSFSVRNFPASSRAYIFDEWSLSVGGVANVRTRSPRLHDNVTAIERITPNGVSRALLTSYERELLYPQDTLIIEDTSAAASLVGLTTLIYYEDLPGTSARLYHWAELEPRILHLYGIPVAITTGGTAGDYEGAVAINATDDQLKANTDYAILGWASDTELQTVGIRSADFGNLRVGGPGTVEQIETRDWFVRMDALIGRPAIPVFNAANKSNTIVDVVDSAAAGSANLNILLAELSTPGGQVS